MDQFLTDKEREELRNRQRRERDRRIADRIKAVLLRDKGWSYQKIGEALMVDEETVSHHVQEYQKKKSLNLRMGILKAN